jgi:CheY-like chemotaxis protein
LAEPRVLIVTREVKFATNAISALEATGYKVTTFTNSRPALDYLRQNPQDLAVLDFRVNDMPAPDTLDHMRAMQPDIALIAAPNHPAVHDLKEKHNLQAIINIPYPLWRFVEVLEAALKSVQEAKPNKQADKPLKPPKIAAIEFWVSNKEDGETVLEVAPGLKEVPPDNLETKVFDKLAAEEPPMPSFEEGSTVGDLRKHLTDPDNIRRIIETFSDDSTARNAAPDKQDEVNEDSRSIPAAVILEAAMDESTPIRTFSLNEFMNRAQESGKQILVPPSWLQEDQKYIREPEFLPEDLPSITNTFEYTVTKTEPNSAQREQIETDPTNLVTDQIEPIQRSRPPKSLPEMPLDTDKVRVNTQLPLPEMPSDTVKGKPPTQIPSPPPLPEMPIERMAEVLDEDEAAAHAADFEKIKSDPKLVKVPELPKVAAESATEKAVPFADYDKSNPYVAELALKLTQVSLELSVEASVLVDKGEIIAYSGNLPREDIEEMRGQLEIDWNAEGDKSRIRFITLPGSGTDYMLFTCQTSSGHILSMIFGGLTPLHVIRRQGKRLSEALAVVAPPELPAPEISPEAEAAEALQIPTDEEVGERAARTLVWMLRDPDAMLQDTVAQATVRGLGNELAKAGWRVHDVEVHQDFVYVYGDMPVHFNAKQVIHELMQLSAAIVSLKTGDVDTAMLWNDSYLVLQPGREMNMEEIQRFINFARE